MMRYFGPVTWVNNETSDKMYVSTINEFGYSEGREKEIPAGRRLVMRYRKGMDWSVRVWFRVRADGRPVLENNEIHPCTVFDCSDINIRYKLGDGSVVKDYSDGVLLDFDLVKDPDQVGRIGWFRWFRGCYDSCVALGKRCFAGQEVNDDVQGEAEAMPTTTIEAAQEQPEIQHVINIGEDQEVAMSSSVDETSNSQIAQPEIQSVINDQAEVLIPTVEAQYPISQPDTLQLVINCQAEATPTTDKVPNPPILQLGEAQAIHIPEAPGPPISQPEIQHYVINCQAEASDPPIPQPELQLVIKGQGQGQAKAIHITETSNPPNPPNPQPEFQPVIKGQAEANRVVEAPDPLIQQPEIQLVINYQVEAVLAAEALDPQITQPEIQSFTNCQIEAIPTVEEPDPPISQSDVLAITYQAEAIFVTEAPDPPI